MSPLVRFAGSSACTRTGTAAAAACTRRHLMVLASTSTVAGTSTSTAATPLATTTTTTSTTSHLHLHSHSHLLHSQQRRSFWMDVVRIKTQRPNNKHNKWNKQKDGNNNKQAVHEDPEQVVRRHTDETRSDGEALLDLMFFNDRHEKAWMKRKRLQGIRRYEFDKKHVTDLAKYIAFVQDHKE